MNKEQEQYLEIEALGGIVEADALDRATDDGLLLVSEKDLGAQTQHHHR